MRRPLQNLHLLKADMEKKGWMIDSFKFRYKKISYIVLVILFGQMNHGTNMRWYSLIFLIQPISSIIYLFLPMPEAS